MAKKIIIVKKIILTIF